MPFLGLLIMVIVLWAPKLYSNYYGPSSGGSGVGVQVEGLRVSGFRTKVTRIPLGVHVHRHGPIPVVSIVVPFFGSTKYIIRIL